MEETTERELLKRLESLDDQTLRFIHSYSAEKIRLARTSALISSALTSVAGLAIFATFLFPDTNEIIITVASVFISVIIGFWGVFEKKKQEVNLAYRLFQNSKTVKDQPPEKDQRYKLIEKFIKAGDL